MLCAPLAGRNGDYKHMRPTQVEAYFTAAIEVAAIKCKPYNEELRFSPIDRPRPRRNCRQWSCWKLSLRFERRSLTEAALRPGDPQAASTTPVGAVAAAPGLLNPIRVARGLLDENETLLVSHGAKRYAPPRGLGRFEPRKSPTPETATSCDTVGCVVRDGLGRIAAGTSTGALTGKAEGRVGDTPLPRCGLYADSQVGAVSCSGDGEFIARALLASRVIWDMEQGREIQSAIEHALLRLEWIGGEAGIIGIDCRGRIGWAHRGAQFAVALDARARRADGSARP
jgi:isoaspartyl peptidase/L-asparaginase-like protein (Ntn-hydrolase superfamily)